MPVPLLPPPYLSARWMGFGSKAAWRFCPGLPLASPTADVKEDSVRGDSTQIPKGLIQHLCTSSINLEKGVWSDTDLQGQEIFKEVRFPK